jgi:hypothetical protein
MPDPIELAELLDVDVDDLAWVGAFVAADRFGRLQRRKPVEAEAPENAAHSGRGNANLGGDLLAGMTLPAQSLNGGADGWPRLAWRGKRPRGAVAQAFNPLGLEPLDPLGDGLRRRMELTRGGGFRQPAIHDRANHQLSTFRRQRRIPVRVHSVLCESLTFGNISVHGPNRVDNLLKAHI